MIGLVIASNDGDIVVMLLPTVPYDGNVILGYSIGDVELPPVPIPVDDLLTMIKEAKNGNQKAN